MNRFLFIVAFLAVFAVTVHTPALADVGIETCIQCHEETANAVMKTVHAPQNNISCENCHGNGEAHADDPSTDNIRTFRHATASQILETCSECHGDRHPVKSSHYDLKRSCLNCHTACHTEEFTETSKYKTRIPDRAMLKDPSSQLCLDCHTDIRSKMNRPYNHPMHDYDNVCIGCHQAHESRTQQMGQRMDETCATCHPTKNGPFMFEHLGTRNDGCGGCHEPHGSTHPNLLNRHSTQILCLSCHTDTPAFHDQADPRYRQCTACHTAIHGSNINHLLME